MCEKLHKLACSKYVLMQCPEFYLIFLHAICARCVINVALVLWKRYTNNLANELACVLLKVTNEWTLRDQTDNVTPLNKTILSETSIFDFLLLYPHSFFINFVITVFLLWEQFICTGIK